MKGKKHSESFRDEWRERRSAEREIERKREDK